MLELNTWWLTLCVILAFYNMCVLYKLGAPVGVGSRIARTLGMMACLSIVFAPFEFRLGVDFLSELSFFLLFCSYAAQNSQFHVEEKGWRKGVGGGKLHKKFVEAIVQPASEQKEPTR